ncbi:MAG: hypothetical protein HYT12_01610 [Candidatus Liptonbacteria bacterium]|nr:hypothetical protein [Candidatus Liptonbacteria bacterium]
MRKYEYIMPIACRLGRLRRNLRNQLKVQPRKSRSTCFITVLASIALLILAVLQFRSANAQSTPAFWVTWGADSYVPDYFIGKAMPSRASNITVSFEILENGKPLSLSGQEVRWFINNTIAAKGVALKTFSFRAGASAPLVRIELPGFRGGASLIKSFQIPVREPEIVIKAAGVAQAGQDISLSAISYFFNIQNLSELFFTWKVNSVSPEGTPKNPELLTISVPTEAKSGDKIITEVFVGTYGSSLRVSGRKILTVK